MLNPSFAFAQQDSLRKMKFFATALLLVMMVLYALARYYHERHAFFALLSAFSEAAMVGALADWFAVVALFRYPLTLPIPHTAIIPKNKDKFGKHLAHFIRDHFFNPEVLEEKLKSHDITGMIGKILADDQTAKDLVSKFFIYTAVVIRDEDLQNLSKQIIHDNTANLQLGPWVSKIMETITEDGTHQLLLDGLLNTAQDWLRAQEYNLRLKVKVETPWWLPNMVDDTIMDNILGGLKDTMIRIKNDRHHQLRTKFDDWVNKLINHLKDPSSLSAPYSEWPDLKDFAAQLSARVKQKILADVQDPESTIRGQLEQTLIFLGKLLAENQPLRTKMNHWIGSSLSDLLHTYADAICSIISDTIQKWDAERTSTVIETYIGRDLQWIRVNGTLVGGGVGLLIYICSNYFIVA